MKEWADNNAFNSFNPWKGLLYTEQFKQIAAGIVPVPVQARIDPTLKCPLNCEWCNSARYRKAGHELTTEHVMDVLRFLKEWGVQAVVWAGGGEPTFHPRFTEMLQYNALLGMDAAILSNGVCDGATAEQIGQLCRWAGISVDAGTARTYKALKGADAFDKVLDNIHTMAIQDGRCNVGYKFLITPDNQHELMTACILAREAGAHDFVARPMDTQHQGMAGKHFDVADFNVDQMLRQFELCHGLESDDFHVYTVTHKFDEDMGHSKDFSQCYGAPLRIHIATDGNVYFCDDQYYQERYKLGTHSPRPAEILEFWGGEGHKKLLYGDTPSRCTTRCCIGDHCILCERLFVSDDDPMCARYP